MRLLLAILASASILLAGCIQAPEGETPASTHDARAIPDDDLVPPVDRIEGMSAEETAEDAVGICPDNGITIPPGGWCGERTLLVEGRIGLDRLPLVDLRSVNGDVEIREGAGDAWSFLAVVKTRGLTEEDARRALDEGWSWSHEDGEGGHHVKASPTPRIPLVGAGVTQLEYVLVLPGWVALDEVLVSSTNGDLHVTGFKMGTLRLDTTNGDVVARGRADDVSVSTTNGEIEAVLLPVKGGAWSFRTTNGDVELVASEHLSRGYDVEGRTTNGEVEILLTQGKVKDEDRNHKTFRTDGYEQRSVRTEIDLASTNGGITVLG